MDKLLRTANSISSTIASSIAPERE